MHFVNFLLLNVVLLLTNNQLSAHGLGGNTMVKLVKSSVEEWQTIKQIYDITVSQDLRAKSFNPETNIWSPQPIKVAGFSETNCYIRIRVDQSIINVIECTPSQEFYEIKLQRWIPACQLHAGHNLLRDNTDGRGESIEIIDIELISKPLPVYILEITNTHTFLVTGLSILTHNDVLTPTLFYAVGQSVFGSSVGGATVGSAIGPFGTLGGFVIGGLVAVGATYCFGDWDRTWYKLKYDVKKVRQALSDVQRLFRSKLNGQNANPSNNQSSSNNTGNNLDPKKDDDDNNNNFFNNLKKNSDKVVRSDRFGKMYRDPKTRLWWSRDRANHGGSAYKVFRETSRGLEWEYDANMLGETIIGKHKGPTGLFIPFKDVGVCS